MIGERRLEAALHDLRGDGRGHGVVDRGQGFHGSGGAQGVGPERQPAEQQHDQAPTRGAEHAAQKAVARAAHTVPAPREAIIAFFFSWLASMKRSKNDVMVA